MTYQWKYITLNQSYSIITIIPDNLILNNIINYIHNLFELNDKEIVAKQEASNAHMQIP